MAIFWELRDETGPLESSQKLRFVGLVAGETTDFTQLLNCGGVPPIFLKLTKNNIFLYSILF